ncbi:hypothetical protein IFR05_000318 [Cadophora sp. M221]|nr:hypothetical protein IFR05_000318 [Cadophora sp. M221]
MVNTGKVSIPILWTAMCDEERPSCLRCLKYKKPCPGYREWTEDKLRYKPRAPRKKPTEDAVQGPLVPRVRGSSQSSITKSFLLGLANSSGSSALQRQLSAAKPAIYRPLMDQIDLQAECFFIANFVKIPEAGPNKGYLDFVIPLLNAPTASRCLPLAFSAVTLAAFGTHQHSPVSLPKTRMLYLQALNEINSALQDPIQAVDDSVVASVLLLAKFEQISPSEMALRGWKSHIDGALTLLKARSAEQRRSRYGADLTVAVREQMMPISIGAGIPLDPEFDWLETNTDDFDKSFSRLNIEMSSLQADNKCTTKLAERSTENIEKVIQLLRRAEFLEQQYADWLAALSPSWVVATTDWSDFEPSNIGTSLVYPGRVYSFKELWMANKCSVARSCRLLIWSTILRCMAWLKGPHEYRMTTEYAEGSRKCRTLIEDIVSSVPYYFGWTTMTSPATANTFEYSAEIQASTKGRSSLFLLWPLYVTSSSDFASPSERTYIRGKMRYIAENLGVNQAVIALRDELLHPSKFIKRDGQTFGQQQPEPRQLDGEERHLFEQHINVPCKSDCIGSSLKQMSPV